MPGARGEGMHVSPGLWGCSLACHLHPLLPCTLHALPKHPHTARPHLAPASLSQPWLLAFQHPGQLQGLSGHCWATSRGGQSAPVFSCTQMELPGPPPPNPLGKGWGMSFLLSLIPPPGNFACNFKNHRRGRTCLLILFSQLLALMSFIFPDVGVRN